jgi:hypothetical protein
MKQNFTVRQATLDGVEAFLNVPTPKLSPSGRRPRGCSSGD